MKKTNKPEFTYSGINFFPGDKEKLMKVLSTTPTVYSSFSQFVRASINLHLKKLNIDFTITERGESL